MPIKSYLILTQEGQKKMLEKRISAIPECEVTASENKEVLVVLTDTVDEEADSSLFEKLSALPGLKHLNLVAALSE